MVVCGEGALVLAFSLSNFYTRKFKLPATSQKKDLWVMHIVKEGTLIA
jgi:hypothetical protein